MAESLAFSKGASRQTIYAEIAPQIEALVSGESDLIANLANVAAALKQSLGFLWIGFYLAKDGELVLGPFQGPVACTRLGFGEGVCGHSYSTKSTVVVPEVEKFPGHIACSSDSRSEIVVPLFREDRTVFAVLDVDSDLIDDFSDVDKAGLERIARIIEIGAA